MENRVISRIDEGVQTLTLNRPAKLNCIDWEMLEQVQEAVKRSATNDEVKVLLLRGAGERSFSTGGDLNAFQSLDSVETKRWIRLGQEILNGLESLPKPTVAVIHGYAYGGGLELALACDLRLATTAASFSSPELGLGWIPGWGALTRLRRLVGESRAKEIIYLGRRLDAGAAERIGLVNQVLPETELESELATWCEQLKKLDPVVFALAKTALNDPARQTVGTGLDFDILATLQSIRFRKE